MKQPHSYHIFLFPFRWDYFEDANKEYSFAERTNLENFRNLLKDENWEKNKKYELEKSQDYNEYTYFYPFVRKAVFDTDEKNKILNHYSYNLNGDEKYIIKIKDGNIYELDLENIYLHVYSTGVALLSYHLQNFKYKHLDDILKINDFGKRIYPQFLGAKKD